MPVTARLSRGLWAGTIVVTLLASTGCEDTPPPPPPKPAPKAVPVTTPASAEEQATVAQFQQRSAELLQGLSVCSTTLTTLGGQFLQQPDDANLESLKTQWRACLILYRASTVLQGFTPAHQSALQQHHSALGNPLQMPGFIDSVEGYPFSGIVNDASLPLDAATLREQHGLTDDADVSIGFDVVGFLLWGEHQLNASLPQRSVTDYFAVNNWEDSTIDLPVEEHPNNRRRQLLALTLQLLTEDCLALLQQWRDTTPPGTREALQAWQVSQLQAMLTALEQQPDNDQLSSHLQSWLEDKIIPGQTSNNTDLRQSLSEALNQLTKQG